MAGKAADPDKKVRVKFLKLWSADIGVFLRGEEAELPETTAVSLSLEIDPARNEADPVVELI